jgi:glycosyltransferase involved in cell wall biosynthesis
MARVSLCMIVRDEEAFAPRFLKAAAGAYDQLVVVDTGSRDRTAGLFRDAGAEVHECPWCDDFAFARNESLRRADGDWILVLDADEFPADGFVDELQTLTRRDDVGAATIEWLNEQRCGLDSRSRLLRLFRNDPAIRYRGRIHEDASGTVQAMLERTGTRLGHVKTTVRHVGYRSDVMATRGKEQRDEHLLNMAAAEDEGDLYSRYKLLELYRFHGRAADMTDTAAECLTLIRSGTPVVPPHIAGDLVEMIRGALDGGDIDLGIAFLEDMEPVAGHTGHYHLALGMQRERKGQLELAEHHFRATLARAAASPWELLLRTRALMGLSRLALEAGRMDDARTNVLAALALAPEDPEANLAKCLFQP